MKEKVQGHQGPKDTADAGTTRAAQETASGVNPKVKRWSRTAGWAIEACLLGWTLARGYLSRSPNPGQTPASPLDPIPAAEPESVPAIAAPVPPKGKTGRAADRNLNLESDSKRALRHKWGTVFVLCAFALAMAGGVGFVVAYWSGGSNQELAGSAAIFLGGFGAALVLYAHWLTAHKEATEPREKLPSSAAERDGVLEDYCAGMNEVHRRSLLKWMGAAGVGVFGAMILSLMRSLGMSPYPGLTATVWKRGQRLMTLEGNPVTVHSLQTGSTVTVFPEDSLGSEKAQTVLIRVQEQLLQLPADRADWAPMGYVAYSRVCTHAGCTVGLFETTTNLLLCPCHQSTFDVRRSSGSHADRRPSGPSFAAAADLCRH